ncbi:MULTISPECIES: SH3 domain-containing protein [unclassified Mesorhizobium]|uniref:SH3 domain-containing protein n=1 Tax=unclassified Mesorhizobium TaxID=325217 RepID=UPI00112B8155|nr:MULTISPECIES: SH3 domain-containing protein [unclassified Mesorhizobium]MBZ9896696.1 SH3 domain-containing protein [Mesorhizobium sp. BR1-1-6]MBZ9916935.1 SH3 domain-containing protein [Mesorhizobium sp. BR1-1-7]MBZ9955355.1 SH3 domain-containing protein [Mesorhizobium sp. BR1-1-15]MBZ9957811.1 SH3 domain-containing protein [Mesorhizobium sp. BR1-1-14]MBZ9969246.1 SH3 domain-containing protein [Mesorhizobium sp. BR1-1-12]
MRFRFLLCLATILAAILGTSAAAFAYSAHTTTNLNVRSGPGSGYAKVGTLPAGYRVNVTGCQPGWCRIHGGGFSGWASSGYLSRAHVVRPPVIIVRPPHGPPHWQHRPHRPPHHRPPHKPRPGKCKIAPGFSCK